MPRILCVRVYKRLVIPTIVGEMVDRKREDVYKRLVIPTIVGQ